MFEFEKMLFNSVVKSFNESNKSHKVIVLMENSDYRHYRCKSDHSGFHSFDVVTWPNYLAYVGDTGQFVFHRENTDMLAFCAYNYNNFGYLAEKCIACSFHDDHSKVKKFDIVYAEQVIRYNLSDILDDPEDSRNDALVKLLESMPEDEAKLIDTYMRFSDDFPDFTTYTRRFLWFTRAIDFLSAKLKTNDVIRN